MTTKYLCVSDSLKEGIKPNLINGPRDKFPDKARYQ